MFQGLLQIEMKVSDNMGKVDEEQQQTVNNKQTKNPKTNKRMQKCSNSGGTREAQTKVTMGSPFISIRLEK